MFKRFLLYGMLFSVALASLVPVSAQPVADKPIPVAAPNVPGGKVVLVPRDQLRVGPGTKTIRISRVTRDGVENGAIPVPKVWDWTKGETIKLPILGNNRYGDCFYAAPCHVVQAMTGMNGITTMFDESAVIKRYLQISGGDNGLSDNQVFPEFKAGIVGPRGPHKALDIMVISSNDLTVQNLCSWAYGPMMFTFTVYQNFTAVGPGSVVDGNSGTVVGGHAVVFNGRDEQGRWRVATWGLQPSVLVTDKWVRGVEPEFISVFSLEWFNPKTGYAPNGLHYNDLAVMWNGMGGNVPLTGPFPPPGPPTPPTPVPPIPPVPPQPVPPGTGFSGYITYTFSNGVLTGPPAVTPKTDRK